MSQITLVIQHPSGLHARPASLFVQTARQFTADARTQIKVRNETAGRGPVDASSILGVLTLGVQRGHTIGIQAEGQAADEALAALRTLCETNFGEAVPVS